jgi:hypothetical protein
MGKNPYSDPRWWDDPKARDVSCNRCANYLGFAKCRAFPERIPRELLTVEVRHALPYPGDGGYLFTPKAAAAQNAKEAVA